MKILWKTLLQFGELCIAIFQGCHATPSEWEYIFWLRGKCKANVPEVSSTGQESVKVSHREDHTDPCIECDSIEINDKPFDGEKFLSKAKEVQKNMV